MDALLDARSLDVLDFGRIRERYAGLTHAARAHARALACEPAVDFAVTRRLVGETAEMRALARAEGIPMTRIEDVDDALASAARGVTLGARDLRDIADAMAAAAAAVRAIRETELDLPLLRARAQAFVPLPSVVAPIHDAIDERGTVLDRASRELARIRRGIAQAQDDARERAAALVRSSRYARAMQDQIVTVRDGRFVVPVKAEFAGEVRGIVHDTSSTGQTLFVEPLETLEANNRVRALRAQEEHEIARILTDLSSRVQSVASQIAAALELYVDLDLAAARAALAERQNAVAPELVDAPVIAITDGRHPLLDDRAVPQSLRLGDGTQIIIISGPNMGGKTVALKLVGLTVAMTGCGMHVPAATATVGRFSRVMTDIGDEQSIAQNASTFSAHLRRLAEIVDVVDDRTLVLIDEIGSGTEPNAGAALAVAVLERFLERGARVACTTHATELKLFGADHPHVANASVRFDPQTYEPTYQLDIGTPGRSLAFALARRMRLDGAVIERAESLQSSAERDYERALAEATEERTRAVREREQLERERGHVRSLEENARRRGEALERERRELARKADVQMADALRRFTEELARRQEAAAREGSRGSARPRVTSGQADLLARTLEQMHRELGITQERARPGDRPATIAVGDKVRVVSWDQEGTVAEDLGDNVLVQMGAMRVTVPKSDVRPKGLSATAAGSMVSAANERRSRGGGGEATLQTAAEAQTQLDVRGKRYIEAEPLVERWIDDAVMLGHSPLRLVHGKGTGLLGRGLQEYLRAHPMVQGVRYGHADEGGGGVTVFELKALSA